MTSLSFADSYELRNTRLAEYEQQALDMSIMRALVPSMAGRCDVGVTESRFDSLETYRCFRSKLTRAVSEVGEYSQLSPHLADATINRNDHEMFRMLKASNVPIDEQRVFFRNLRTDQD